MLDVYSFQPKKLIRLHSCFLLIFCSTPSFTLTHDETHIQVGQLQAKKFFLEQTRDNPPPSGVEDLLKELKDEVDVASDKVNRMEETAEEMKTKCLRKRQDKEVDGNPCADYYDHMMLLSQSYQGSYYMIITSCVCIWHSWAEETSLGPLIVTLNGVQGFLTLFIPKLGHGVNLNGSVCTVCTSH